MNTTKLLTETEVNIRRYLPREVNYYYFLYTHAQLSNESIKNQFLQILKKVNKAIIKRTILKEPS